MATSRSYQAQAPFIRPVKTADLEPLKDFLGKLSPGSLYFRFGRPCVPQWSDEKWAKLCQPDTRHSMGMVTTEVIAPGRYAIVGMARLVAEANSQRAEFSMVVADHLQHQGLGTELMGALVNEARCRGLIEIYGDVLPSNHAMIRFCQGLGMVRSACPDDVRLYRMALRIRPQSRGVSLSSAAQALHRHTDVRAI